jgi:hypothetical protein
MSQYKIIIAYMKRMLFLSAMCLAFFLSGSAQNTNSPKLGNDPVSKIISAMTLEEKAAFVVGTGNAYDWSTTSISRW